MHFLSPKITQKSVGKVIVSIKAVKINIKRQKFDKTPPISQNALN